MPLSLLQWALALTPAPLPAPQSPPLTRYEAVGQSLDPAPPEQRDDVRIKNDRHQRMTVQVSLGASGPYRFLVDTGADRTSLSRQLAGTLKLEERPSGSLHSASESSQVPMAFVPELRLSRKTVRRINAPLLDAEMIGADGILGMDSLRSHRVLFDFAAQKLTIHSSANSRSKPSGDAIVVRARRREGRLVITDARAEGRVTNVVIDTGAELSIGNPELRRFLEEQGALTPVGPMELVSVTGGVMRGELAFVRQLELGGVKLERLAVVFTDAHIFRMLKLDSKPTLLLGMNALRSFDQVWIDFASRKLSLVPPGRSARRAEPLQTSCGPM